MSMDIPANYTDNWLIIIFLVLVSSFFFIFSDGEF